MTSPSSTNGFPIVARRSIGAKSTLCLADGQVIDTRRYVPAGKGDVLRQIKGDVEIFVKNDAVWVPLSAPWYFNSKMTIGDEIINIHFKEIESEDELALFEELRRFHYRGGGGAGRTVPLIAKSDRWDLPRVLGFIEIASSMIANSARKRFMQHPFFESREIQWNCWDSGSARRYANLICRISRFVVHPELRGTGLAAEFINAAKQYASARWHFGGWKPRFIEITADMLRYYRFLKSDFAFMGETEGNGHRLERDMNYLVRKALTVGETMPQGGGGIMTLQRGYASQLLNFSDPEGRGIAKLVQQLSHSPSSLDQKTWEALYRLNRRPKPSYISGLTEQASKYVDTQDIRMNNSASRAHSHQPKAWTFEDLSVVASSSIEQSSEGRAMQEAFGFVGSDLRSEVFKDLTFSLKTSSVTLICGASGSGKSLMLYACKALIDGSSSDASLAGIHITGTVSSKAKVSSLPILPQHLSALALKGTAPLERFLEITGLCGLAEPQLLVRPISTLSSGQQYRLSIALAFLNRCDILIIDNFCEPLDRFTAKAVAKGVRRLARKEGVAVVAATATYDRAFLLGEMDQAILLRRGDKPTVIRGEQGHDLQKGFLYHPLPD